MYSAVMLSESPAAASSSARAAVAALFLLALPKGRLCWRSCRGLVGVPRDHVSRVNDGLGGLLKKPEVTAECVVRFTPALPTWVLGHVGLSDGGALLRIRDDKESHAAAST